MSYTTEISKFSYFEVIFLWRSSFIGACLQHNLFWLWFDLMSICVKFEEDSISGCWDIQIFIFWSHRPLQVVLHWRLSSLKLFFTRDCSPEPMFKIWGKFEQWLLRYSNFCILRSSSIKGRLPLKVVFHWRSSSLKVVFIEIFLDLGLVPWAHV